MEKKSITAREGKLSLKEIITDGLSWTDWLRCMWAGFSVLGTAMMGEAIVEAPLWVFALVILNLFLSCREVNMVQFPEDNKSE